VKSRKNEEGKKEQRKGEEGEKPSGKTHMSPGEKRRW